MDQKLLLLVNPQAGKSEIRGKLCDVVDLFVRYGYEVTVYTTQRAKEIPDILRRRGGDYDLVVCSGGDGTLNETVTGLLELPDRPPLGYIPSGTVNDFASSLRIPKDILQAAEVAVNGIPYAIDVGRFNERCFTYIAAFGAFTGVSYQTPQQYKNMLGRAAYLLEGIRSIASIKPYHLTVEYPDGREEGDFIFGMVSNSTSVGGFQFGVQPDVSMNDGLLEVAMIRSPQSVLELQKIVSRVLLQDMDPEFILSFKANRISFQAQDKLPWTLDGEYGGSVRQVEISTCKQAIRVLTDRSGYPELPPGERKLLKTSEYYRPGQPE